MFYAILAQAAFRKIPALYRNKSSLKRKDSCIGFIVILSTQPQKFNIPLTARKTLEQHAKIVATLLYTASEIELLASFQYKAQSSYYRFQFNMEALYLYASVSPIKLQTRIKLGRNMFFLPDFQFIFNLAILQPNNP